MEAKPGSPQIDLLVRRSSAAKLKKIVSLRALTSDIERILALLGCSSSELSVVITSDREIRKLNAQYRAKDKATDVLSFPLQEGPETFGAAQMLGDIVISVDTTLRQAKEYGVSNLQELRRLIVHGTLHLLGYDHEKVAPAAAARMRRKEQSLLKALAGPEAPKRPSRPQSTARRRPSGAGTALRPTSKQKSRRKPAPKKK